MTCPRCGAKMVPILYGLPHFPDDPELDRAIAAGADHRGCVIPSGPSPVELCARAASSA